MSAISTEKLSALDVISKKVSIAVEAQRLTGGSTFKGVIDGLTSALAPTKALLATTLKLSAAFAAVYVTYKLADYLAHTGERANSQMEESASSYESSKSKIESVNSQLKTTQDRINELQAKGDLTFVEKGELDKLRADSLQLSKSLLFHMNGSLQPVFIQSKPTIYFTVKFT